MRQLSRDMLAAALSQKVVACCPPLARRSDHPILAWTDEKVPPDTATMT